MLQFYFNNVTNLHRLTSAVRHHRSHRDHRLLWRHFNLSMHVEKSRLNISSFIQEIRKDRVETNGRTDRHDRSHYPSR